MRPLSIDEVTDSINQRIMVCMKKHHNLFLVGPMGAGKSTVGRKLADALKLEFVDLDHYIEEKTGADIPLIFEYEGEDGFRKREHDALNQLSVQEDLVIATGGGVVLRPENRSLLKANGLVIYLQTDVDVQLARLHRCTKRPLLQAPDRRERLTEMARERNPLYQGVSDLTMVSGKVSVPAMAKQTLQSLKHYFPEFCERHGCHYDDAAS